MRERFKIILVGDAGVGKTSLFKRYIYDMHEPDYRPTLGINFNTKDLLVDGTYFKIQIWDREKEQFKTIYYRDIDAILLTFDLTNRNSFLQLDKHLQEIKAHAPKNAPIILVDNKSDLVNDPVVTSSEFDEFMQDNKICDYFKTSAKVEAPEAKAQIEKLFSTALKKSLEGNKQCSDSSVVINANEESANEKEKLLSRSGQANGLSSLYKPTLKDLLVIRLKKYIDRIESYLGKDNEDNRYTHGFWFFKKSRAMNRKANYQFAWQLLNALEVSNGTSEAINCIFQKIDDKRANIFAGLAFEGQEKIYPNCGINSTELNEVIEFANDSLRRKPL